MRPSLPTVNFGHLERMTTAEGLYEHALLAEPRKEHGYCLDDVSRGLVVAVRERDASPGVSEMVTTYLRFTAAAQDASGAFHNRRRTGGRWTDSPTVNDHWGRALWAVGIASDVADGTVRTRSLAVAECAMRARSSWPRSMAYAALGGAEVLRSRPDHQPAIRLLADARTMLGGPLASPGWPWPEPRLTYANAVLPEAFIAIGRALDDDALIRRGLELLGWLVELQTRNGHISVTPAHGFSPGDSLPGFDQQPIEVSALAEASWRAHEVTGDARWVDVVQQCAAWFMGANDVGLTLYDEATGGCADGLHTGRINLNRGAESTLAALSTLQLAGRRALVAH